MYIAWMYVTKGSGSNGINTVYQVGNTGVLPSGTTAELAALPITILPGFPTSLASGVDQNGNPAPIAFPFGIWFANAETLYVCNEGDGTLVTPAVNGNVADAATPATAGVQKWSLVSGTWHLDYVLQNGLNIGIPYSVPNYPTSLTPATDGCRNITGESPRRWHCGHLRGDLDSQHEWRSGCRSQQVGEGHRHSESEQSAEG